MCIDHSFNDSYHTFAESIGRTISATWRNTGAIWLLKITKGIWSFLTRIPLVKLVWIFFRVETSPRKVRQFEFLKILSDSSVWIHSWPTLPTAARLRTTPHFQLKNWQNWFFSLTRRKYDPKFLYPHWLNISPMQVDRVYGFFLAKLYSADSPRMAALGL